jgi:hypothetical protein
MVLDVLHEAEREAYRAWLLASDLEREAKWCDWQFKLRLLVSEQACRSSLTDALKTQPQPTEVQ